MRMSHVWELGSVPFKYQRTPSYLLKDNLYISTLNINYLIDVKIDQFLFIPPCMFTAV